MRVMPYLYGYHVPSQLDTHTHTHTHMHHTRMHAHTHTHLYLFPMFMSPRMDW